MWAHVRTVCCLLTAHSSRHTEVTAVSVDANCISRTTVGVIAFVQIYIQVNISQPLNTSRITINDFVKAIIDFDSTKKNTIKFYRLQNNVVSKTKLDKKIIFKWQLHKLTQRSMMKFDHSTAYVIDNALLMHHGLWRRGKGSNKGN